VKLSSEIKRPPPRVISVPLPIRLWKLLRPMILGSVSNKNISYSLELVQPTDGPLDGLKEVSLTHKVDIIVVLVISVYSEEPSLKPISVPVSMLELSLLVLMPKLPQDNGNIKSVSLKVSNVVITSGLPDISSSVLVRNSV